MNVEPKNRIIKPVKEIDLTLDELHTLALAQRSYEDNDPVYAEYNIAERLLSLWAYWMDRADDDHFALRLKRV